MEEISDLNECRRKLEACLNENIRLEYFAALRKVYLFKEPMNKLVFDRDVRKLLVNEDQVHCHNKFILALFSDPDKGPKTVGERVVFESAAFSDYIRSAGPLPPPEQYEHRRAAAELFLPDSGFVTNKITLTAWDCGLEGADNKVTDLMVHACQVFVKNIIMAMVSRKKGYKMRENKFQYGFNLPIPDPFTYNYQNVIDNTEENKVEVMDGEDTFIPRQKPSMENMEHQLAFSYSLAKRRKSDNALSVKLLYETLRNNPHLLGLQDMQCMALFKLSLQLDNC